jgi:hypothetical protein
VWLPAACGNIQSQCVAVELGEPTARSQGMQTLPSSHWLAEKLFSHSQPKSASKAREGHRQAADDSALAAYAPYPPLKVHRDLVRTVCRTCFTYLIRIGGMTTGTGGIGVETVIPGRGYHNAVAINVDIRRSRPAPGEVHYVLTLYCSHTH